MNNEEIKIHIRRSRKHYYLRKRKISWKKDKTTSWKKENEKEKIPWEGEFSLRSDLWAGLIASCGSFYPMVPRLRSHFFESPIFSWIFVLDFFHLLNNFHFFWHFLWFAKWFVFVLISGFFFLVLIFFILNLDGVKNLWNKKIKFPKDKISSWRMKLLSEIHRLCLRIPLHQLFSNIFKELQKVLQDFFVVFFHLLLNPNKCFENDFVFVFKF